MNYKFSVEVRRALAAAREEAVALRHHYIGTEHLLLGLLRNPESDVAMALAALRIRPEALRGAILEIAQPGKVTPDRRGEVPYTSRAKKALEFAMAEARSLATGEIRDEHLLLGLLLEQKGIAAQALNALGADLARVRAFLRGERVGEADAGPPFSIEIDDTSEQSIYEQIIARIQERVATGRLKPGDRLPSVRQAADKLDVAPGTVARAYSELERLGVVVTEGARGTRVADRSRGAAPVSDRPDALAGLLRPVAVAAFHMGSSATELRGALEEAMKGIFDAA